MKVSDFNYHLPDELIAQYPPENRTDSRLLAMNGDSTQVGLQISDLHIKDMVDLLEEGDLLVLNNTKVIPARLWGRKETGGRIEILLERVIDEQHFIAQIRSSKSPKTGQHLIIDGDESNSLLVTGRQGQFFELQSSQQGSLFAWLEKVGHIPLPPYIERNDEQQDEQRYQTVFAEQQGAVAAPTAGLHYDEELLDKIRAKGVNICTVTLHVGAGTYQPVRVDDVQQHQMHAEYIEVEQACCQAVMRTKQQGKRVVAVGTTVVRCLETAANKAQNELIEPYQGDTDIFIYPGYQFKIVDALQTNFHLPESTLLMLVSAFAGSQTIKQLYQHAIENKYRFFSYGDAMWLQRI